MKQFHINAGIIGERVICADYFAQQGDYFWFFKNQEEVVAILKVDHIISIDVI